MHFHIGVMEFVVFAMYYFILKAILTVLNLQCRRGGNKTSAAVTGLLA